MTTRAITVDSAPVEERAAELGRVLVDDVGIDAEVPGQREAVDEFPVISETERIATSGTTKKRTSQAPPGGSSRYGTEPARRAARASLAAAHDWKIGSKIEVYSSWSATPLKS